MFVLRDRVREISRSTGTGNLSCDGARDSTFVTFASGMVTGDQTYYMAVDSVAGLWEGGICTLQTDGSLARSPIVNQSGTNTLVDFPIGVRDLFSSVLASRISTIDLSLIPNVIQEITAGQGISLGAGMATTAAGGDILTGQVFVAVADSGVIAQTAQGTAMTVDRTGRITNIDSVNVSVFAVATGGGSVTTGTKPVAFIQSTGTITGLLTLTISGGLTDRQTVIFQHACSNIAWVAGTGILAGVTLPSSVTAGQSVTFTWLPSRAEWFHAVPV